MISRLEIQSSDEIVFSWFLPVYSLVASSGSIQTVMASLATHSSFDTWSRAGHFVSTLIG